MSIKVIIYAEALNVMELSEAIDYAMDKIQDEIPYYHETNGDNYFEYTTTMEQPNFDKTLEHLTKRVK